MKIKPRVEIYQICDYGVTLNIKIDYDKGTVSFLDKNISRKAEFIFAERGVEYLAGWQNIFKAISSATAWAEDKLRKESDNKRKETVELHGLLNDKEYEGQNGK